MVSSVMLSQICAGQSLRPSVLYTVAVRCSPLRTIGMIAIARVAHALDRVAFDFRRRLGRLGRRARIYTCENKADGCPNAIREPEHRLTCAKRGAALISFGVSVKNSGVSAIQPNAPSQ